MHLTSNAPISSGGRLLREVSTIWSVESLLEPEQKVD